MLLAAVASLVAPFGGFLASAIKRAHGVKDFDSIIPGHGGFTDRFDCQMLMALYAWVHYTTFVLSYLEPRDRMLAAIADMPSADQAYIAAALREQGL